MGFEPVAGGEPDDIVDAIAEQSTVNGFSNRMETVKSWPEAPRHVFFLHLAGTGIGVSGYQQWFPNTTRDEIEGVLSALKAAGCHRLLALTREMIGLAQGGCGAWGHARFAAQVDAGWWEAHGRPTSRTWKTLDHHEDVLTLCHDELWPRRDAYVLEHRDELV